MSTQTLPDPVGQAEFYADIPTKRFVAWAVDTTLTLTLSILALPFTFFVGLFFFPVLWLFIDFLYRWVTLSGRSATWGMRLAAIELRDLRGDRVDAGTAFVHSAVYAVAMGTFVLQTLSVVLILMSPRRQNLGDHLLGTVAINRAAAH